MNTTSGTWPLNSESHSSHNWYNSKTFGYVPCEERILLTKENVKDFLGFLSKAKHIYIIGVWFGYDSEYTKGRYIRCEALIVSYHTHASSQVNIVKFPLGRLYSQYSPEINN